MELHKGEMIMTILSVRNLTARPVTLLARTRSVVIEPEPTPACVGLVPDVLDGTLTVAEGVALPLFRTQTSTEVFHLPDPIPGTILLVDRSVAEARQDRDDLFFIHRTLRGVDGQVRGSTALARPAEARTARK
jgi:hypothetical protein